MYMDPTRACTSTASWRPTYYFGDRKMGLRCVELTLTQILNQILSCYMTAFDSGLQLKLIS